MTQKKALVEATELAPPSQVGFWDTSVGKTVRAAIYLAVSTGVAVVIADIQNNPELFGYYTPFINILLVLVKNLVSPKVKNI